MITLKLPDHIPIADIGRFAGRYGCILKADSLTELRMVPFHRKAGVAERVMTEVPGVDADDRRCVICRVIHD